MPHRLTVLALGADLSLPVSLDTGQALLMIIVIDATR